MTTKETIKRLIEFNPKISNTQIGEATGLSRSLISYHRRRLRLPQMSPNRSCSFCGKRIGRYNSSGLCKHCKPISYTYEFQCACGGEIHAVDGNEAAQRRNSKKYKVTDLDFCNGRCSGKYFFHKGKALSNTEE